jgi:hypothetical protein
LVLTQSFHTDAIDEEVGGRAEEERDEDDQGGGSVENVRRHLRKAHQTILKRTANGKRIVFSC